MKTSKFLFLAVFFVGSNLCSEVEDALLDLAGGLANIGEDIVAEARAAEKRRGVVTFSRVGEEFHYDFLGGKKIVVVKGDITKIRADVLVDAANKNLSPGAGVSLALFNESGKPSNWSAILGEWSRFLAELPENFKNERSKLLEKILRDPQKFEVGDAVLNSELIKVNGARVVHAVGSDCRNRQEQTVWKELLSSTYKSSLLVVENYNKKVVKEAEKLKSMAFPMISTAMFDCDFEKASVVACDVVVDHLLENGNSIEEVIFVIYKDSQKVETEFANFTKVLDEKAF